uniref:Sulfate_transp domain-containing protein n=1 Tax=Steinernema glaseri TaxID=37863 RepID=A0A1I8AR24_9BILA
MKQQDSHVQAEFDEVFNHNKPGKGLRNAIHRVLPSCNQRQLLNWSFEFFPIIKWLKEYKLFFLMSDIIAGLTVAILNVPQAMAYASLANVPPVIGLYTS